MGQIPLEANPGELPQELACKDPHNIMTPRVPPGGPASAMNA